MKRQPAVLTLIAALAVALVLTACGGGASSKKASTPTLPYCAGSITVGCNPNPPPGPSAGAHMWSGQIMITDQGAYRQIVQDWNLCDHLWWGNWGQYDCNTWDDQASVQLDIFGQTIPSQGRVTIHAYNSYGLVGYLPYNGMAQPINGNTAFSIQAPGGLAGYNDVLRAESNVPNIKNGTQLVQVIRLTLTYNNVPFGYADVILRW